MCTAHGDGGVRGGHGNDGGGPRSTGSQMREYQGQRGRDGANTIRWVPGPGSNVLLHSGFTLIEYIRTRNKLNENSGTVGHGKTGRR